MVSKPKPTPARSAHDSLAERIRELRDEHDELVAEFGDPDEAIDRFAEEFFNSDEAAEVLLEFVRQNIAGAGFAWDEDQAIDKKQEGRG